MEDLIKEVGEDLSLEHSQHPYGEREKLQKRCYECYKSVQYRNLVEDRDLLAHNTGIYE